MNASTCSSDKGIFGIGDYAYNSDTSRAGGSFERAILGLIQGGYDFLKRAIVALLIRGRCRDQETAEALSIGEEGLTGTERFPPVQCPAAIGESILNESVWDLKESVKSMKGSALRFENDWQGMVMEVARGRTAEVQASRSQFLIAFKRELAYVEITCSLADWLRDMGFGAVPDSRELLSELSAMHRLNARVIDLWATAEDLEDLAARDYPLTTADLERWHTSNKPPQSWYEEESMPS